MAPIEFNPPVLVSMGPDRTVRVVSSVAEAFECLSCVYWPRVAKRYSLEALHVCMQALHGYRTVESARLAFIAAAEAAEVLIVGRRDHPGRNLSEGKPPHRQASLQLPST